MYRRLRGLQQRPLSFRIYGASARTYGVFARGLGLIGFRV